MSAPPVLTLPDAPSASDSKTEFNAKAYPFVAAMGPFGASVNQLVAWLNSNISARPVFDISVAESDLSPSQTGGYLRFTFEGAKTLNVPPESSGAQPEGAIFFLTNATTGNLTLAPGDGVVLSSAVILEQGASLILQRVAEDTYDTVPIGGEFTADLSGLAPLASPVFTGDPKAPTPLEGDDSERVSTTEYVQRELLDRPQTIENVAALATFTPVVEQVYYLKEYHAGTGCGGGELIGKAGVITPNNVTTFASGTAGVYLARVNTKIDVYHAGALGGGVVDDHAAIQRYFTWADSTGYTYNATASGGSGFFGARNVLFSSKTDAFCISQPLVLGSYANFDFNHSVFLPHATFDDADFAFDFYSYICRFTNLKLMKFKNGFRLFNDNLNATRIVFDNIDCSGTDVAFDIDLRSAITSIKNSRFDNVNTVIKIRNGDMVELEDSWLSATEMPADNRAHIEINSSHYPGLFVKNLLYVPWPQTKEGLSVVRVAGSATRVTIKDSHFGGEPGQIPIIKSYASGGAPGTRGCHFTLDNVMSYTTTSGGSGSGAIKPAVELHALPDTLNFINYFGVIEGAHAKNLVAYNPDTSSYAAALAATPNSKIYINGHTPENYLGFASGEAETLALLDCSQPESSRSLFKAVTNATTTGNTLFASGTAGRGNAYKVSLVSQSNPGADRYSEYVVSSDGGTAPLGVWTIVPIIEGASSVAGRLFIDAGAVKVRGNSVAAVDVLAIKNRITNIDPY